MASSRFRLLVVDDEPSLRDLASDLLTSEGYDVLTAKDGLDALNQLVDPLPDMIISDLMMPRMSGFELLAVVRQRFPQVPVIAISGEFLGSGLPAGVLADAFLQKGGYTIRQLCAKVRELISASPLRDESGVIGVAPVGVPQDAGS
jgi:CheY-like chemotaxis protein